MSDGLGTADSLTVPHNAGQTMRPLSLGGALGWLHQPSSSAFRKTGVVLVAPLGRDARCAHLPLRLLAEQLARLGYPTLRYDHLGAGDSLDPDPDADSIDVWRRGVRQAVARLKDLSGIEAVVLCGVRIGATLAASVADEAQGLVLLAPVASGSAWLRELKLTASQGPVATTPEPNRLEVDGLSLSTATVAGLEALDLRNLDHLPPDVFLATPTPPGERLRTRLTDSGSRVEMAPFPGFAELFDDAHSNLPPLETFAHLAGWLTAAFPAFGEAGVVEPEWPTLITAHAVETPVAFDGLWGILSTPRDRAPTGVGLAFTNTGGDPRYGIGRFQVEAARALAEVGVTSLRFDFAGLGDSPARGEALRSHVYETCRAADIHAAVAVLRRSGCSEVGLVGVCGGAYHVVRCGLSDPLVRGVLPINPVRLSWSPGDSLQIGRRDQGKATQAYFRLFADPKSWARLLRLEIDLAAVARTIWARTRRRRDARRNSRIRDQFHKDFAAFSARGGRATFLMGIDDAALDEVETYFDARGRALTALPGMSVEVRPGLDHGLMLASSRGSALETVGRFALELREKTRSAPQGAAHRAVALSLVAGVASAVLGIGDLEGVR